MSIEDAQTFIRQIRRDDALNERVRGLKGAGALAAAASIGGEMGLRFTAEEYRAAIALAAKGELSEAAIDAVARQMGIG